MISPNDYKDKVADFWNKSGKKRKEKRKI